MLLNSWGCFNDVMWETVSYAPWSLAWGGRRFWKSEKGKRKMLVLWSARAVSYLSKLSGLLFICCSILLLICTSSPATRIWFSLTDVLQGQQYEPKLPWSLQFTMWTQSNHCRPLARFILHITTKIEFHFTMSLNEMMELSCGVSRLRATSA